MHTIWNNSAHSYGPEEAGLLVKDLQKALNTLFHIAKRWNDRFQKKESVCRLNVLQHKPVFTKAKSEKR